MINYNVFMECLNENSNSFNFDPFIHTLTSPVQKGEGPRAFHMHRHVMWAVCDVSVVQPHLYFCLFGWGHATLKIVPMYAHLNLSCSKRGGAKGWAKGLPYAQACHVDCV